MSAALIIACIASTMLAVAIWHFGAVRPEYSQLRHSISELGELGGLNARIVSFGVFLPFGVAMLLVAWLCQDINLSAARLALCIAAGYVGAALFPCDPGSPISGSWRQFAHNIAGAVQYVGGAAVLRQLSSAAPLLEYAALLVSVAAALLLLAAGSALRGAIQRVAEVVLLGCLVVVINGKGMA